MAPGTAERIPPITEGMRESALSNPNSWLYVIDPAFDPNTEVPAWGIVGAYPVNAYGEIESRFAANDTYRPSPRALGWPEPTTQLERMIQLAKAGHRPARELPAAVLDATLLIYQSRDDRYAPDGLLAFPDRHSGRLVVPACTSVDHVPAGWPGWRSVRARDLVTALGDCPLAINADGPISAIIPAELLREFAAVRESAW
ncbi:MAG TPA: type VII secretion system-associated protein [Pseudonocardiaceae bacterium]|nr:type VII secretion system-associated protein [Pseudonocardiaceae bacterium]